MQVEGAKAKSGAGKADSSQEEQDELELPNFHKHGRGAGMPLLGQVSLLSRPFQLLCLPPGSCWPWVKIC